MIVGGATTVKLDELVPVPPGVVTLMVPVEAPVGTTAVIFVELETVKLLAAVPLNLTDEAPVKLVPVNVTVIPTTPLVGVKLVIVGAGTTVKLDGLVTVPPGVVTLIVPVVVPVATTAAIVVAPDTVKLLAAVPWNLTAVAPFRLVPVMVTEVPIPPLVGVKLVIVGAGTTVKLDELVAVPPGVVTEIVPVVVPVATTAVIFVEPDTVKLLAAVPLNLTDDALVKFVPVSVTVVPTAPLVGVKLVIVGAATTVKLDELVAVPPAVVTLIFPVVAPVGTTALIFVALETVKLLAAVPLNLTAVAPVKLVPVSVTVVPTPPLVGVKLVIVGATTTVFAVTAASAAWKVLVAKARPGKSETAAMDEKPGSWPTGDRTASLV